jgi:lipid A 3-O-deacylase
MKKILALLTACSLHASQHADGFSVYSGAFDVLRDWHRTYEFGLEYKFNPAWQSPFYFLEFRPLLGIMGTATKSTFVYGGIDFDLFLSDQLVFALGFAPGWYRAGDGKNLGFPLEFRSRAELGWQFNGQTRLGVYFYHISNANLGHRNPGEESLGFFFDIPVKSGFPFSRYN